MGVVVHKGAAQDTHRHAFNRVGISCFLVHVWYFEVNVIEFDLYCSFIEITEVSEVKGLHCSLVMVGGTAVLLS